MPLSTNYEVDRRACELHPTHTLFGVTNVYLVVNLRSVERISYVLLALTLESNEIPILSAPKGRTAMPSRVFFPKRFCEIFQLKSTPCLAGI